MLEKRDYERQLVANLPILSVDRGVHVLASGDTNVRQCGGKYTSNKRALPIDYGRRPLVRLSDDATVHVVTDGEQV